MQAGLPLEIEPTAATRSAVTFTLSDRWCTTERDLVDALQRVDFYLIHKAPANDLNTGSLLAPIKVDAL